VLGGNDDGVNAYRLVVFVIFDSDLRFAVGTKIGERAVFAHFSKLFCQLVRKRNRKRHQFFGFVAGVPEHHALVAGAVQIVVVGLPFFHFIRSVHAERNVRRLFVNRNFHFAGVSVKAFFVTVIADFANHVACNFFNIDFCRCRDFAHDHNAVCNTGGLTGNAPVRVLR